MNRVCSILFLRKRFHPLQPESCNLCLPSFYYSYDNSKCVNKERRVNFCVRVSLILTTRLMVVGKADSIWSPENFSLSLGKSLEWCSYRWLNGELQQMVQGLSQDSGLSLVSWLPILISILYLGVLDIKESSKIQSSIRKWKKRLIILKILQS